MNNKILLRRLLISGLGSALILFMGMSLMNYFGSREAPVRQMSFQESLKPVKVSQVEYSSQEISLSVLGRVVSENAIDLLTEVQGEILRGSLSLKRGLSFGRGQVLFKIDDREARLNLYATKSNFMTAVAGILPDLKLDFPEAFDRWEAYFNQMKVEEPLSPLPEIQNSKEKVFLSTRNILNQFYSLKSAEERLSKYTVRAPFSGSFVDVFQEVGSVINPGARVARIARSNRLELETPFRPQDLAFIKRGMQVEVSSEDGKNTWQGTINRIGTAIDPTTQSINVYIRFQAGKAPVFEGQYLRAEIPGSRLREVMEIPRNAILNQNQVYVVEDSVLKVRNIQIEKLEKQTAFFSGLSRGDYVVVEPLVQAYENMPVRMLPLKSEDS